MFLETVGGSVSRTARILELMIRVQARPRFTAAELAGEFGVSWRTILRDLGALRDMDVPLLSTPGPGGGEPRHCGEVSARKPEAGTSAT
jgi:predicted DNA-binding transcriptional regulator YafY